MEKRKMIIRKGAALLLTTLMLLAVAVLPGCSTAPSETSGAPSPSQSSAPAPSSGGVGVTSSPDPEPDPEPVDLGGYEFVFLSAWGAENAIFNPTNGSSPAADARYERIRALEKEHNFTVKINTLPMDNFEQELFAQTMAGIKAADIVLHTVGGILRYYSAGMLNDFNEITAPNLNLDDITRWDPAATNAGTLNGKRYACYLTNQYRMGAICYYNKTLLAEKGCPDPYELYAADRWTWDEFQKLLEYMTIYETGGATPDIYGLGRQPWGCIYLELALVYANGGVVVEDGPDGFRFGLADQNAQDALLFAKSIYDNNWIIPGVPDDIMFLEDIFPKRKVAFWFDSNISGYQETINNMPDEFGILPIPKGPAADDYVSVTGMVVNYFQPITVKPADYFASSFIFNAITEPLSADIDPSFDPEWVLRNSWRVDEGSIQVLKYLEPRVVYTEVVDLFVFHDIVLPAIASCTMEGATTPRAAMEAIAEQAQACIDDIFIAK